MEYFNSLITVYIPSHNYGRFLEEAVESVLRQTYNNWELIIIDDGSTDNTNEIVKLYKSHNKIKVFREKGIGLPSVCNLAIKHSRGEFIIRLDGDDIFNENILLVLGNYLYKNKNCALVFPDYYLVDEFGEIISIEKRERFYEKNHMFDIPPHGACTMIRKSILNEIGGYREDLGAQDGLDLWTKIRDSYEAGNVNLPLFSYRRHGNNLTKNIGKILSARRQIKKDSILEKLKDFKPVIAVIPCRENFDFLPNLWKVKLNGKTLLERDIEVCLASDFIDKIIVACDNDEAKKYIERFDNKIVEFYLREPMSTIRSISIAPTLKEIVKKYDNQFSGITVLRYLQTPFVKTQILNEAISSLVINDADSSCGVELIDQQIYQKSKYGLFPIGKSNKSISSDFDMIYRDSLTFTALKNKNLLRGILQGPLISCFEVSSEESFFINSENDLKIANLLIKEREEENN